MAAQTFPRAARVAALLALIAVASINWRLGFNLVSTPTRPVLRMLQLSRRGGPCGNGEPVERLDFLPGVAPHGAYIMHEHKDNTTTSRFVSQEATARTAAAAVAHIVLLTHLSQEERAVSVMQHWARPRCLRIAGHSLFVRVTPFFFHASQALAAFDWSAVGIGSEDILALTPGLGDTLRTAAAIPAAFTRHGDLTWLFKADDDTFVHVGRLARALMARNASAPHHVGSLMRWVFPPFASGGAGYALSAFAVATLAPIMQTTCLDAVHQSNRTFRESFFEDVMVSFCAQATWGHQVSSDEPGLNLHYPEHVPHYTGAKAAAPAISHHYMLPDLVKEMVFPRVPRRVVQIWPWRDDDDESSSDFLQARSASEICERHARSVGFDYVLERWSNAALHSVTAGVWAPSAAPQVRELVTRLELLYYHGGLAISLWTNCDAINLDMALAAAETVVSKANSAAGVLDQARRDADSIANKISGSPPQLIIDPLDGVGLGSAAGHTLQCFGGDAFQGGCGVAVATRYSLQAFRMYSALAEHALAWHNMDTNGGEHFNSWILRRQTLDEIADTVGITISPPFSSGKSTLNLQQQPLYVTILKRGTAKLTLMQRTLVDMLAFATGKEVNISFSLWSGNDDKPLPPLDVLVFDLHAASNAMLSSFRGVAQSYKGRAPLLVLDLSETYTVPCKDPLLATVHLTLGSAPRHCNASRGHYSVPAWLPYAVELQNTGFVFWPPLHATRFTYGVAQQWASRSLTAAMPLPSKNNHTVDEEDAYITMRRIFKHLHVAVDYYDDDLLEGKSFRDKRFVYAHSTSCDRVSVMSLKDSAVPVCGTSVSHRNGDKSASFNAVFNHKTRVMVLDSSLSFDDSLRPFSLMTSGDLLYLDNAFREPPISDEGHNWLRVWEGVFSSYLRSRLLPT